MQIYNQERPHQSLKLKTPDEVHRASVYYRLDQAGFVFIGVNLWQDGSHQPATPLFGFSKNFSPVACFPYTPIASSCSTSSNEISRV